METLPRLYPILDVDLLLARRYPVPDAARALLNAGVEILQWRCKSLISRRRFDEAEQIAAICRRFGVPFIVNDRADIALLLDAGLHLGQDDLSPAHARRILPGGTIGLSTHNNHQIAAAFAEQVDYLALGPIFATQSKENPDPVVGLDNLNLWRTRTARPLAAIGGITLSNALSVLDAGANSVAVIGGLFPEGASPSGAGSLSAIEQRAREWLSLVR